MFYQMPDNDMAYITAVSFASGFGSEADWYLVEKEGSLHLLF